MSAPPSATPAQPATPTAAAPPAHLATPAAAPGALAQTATSAGQTGAPAHPATPAAAPGALAQPATSAGQATTPAHPGTLAPQAQTAAPSQPGAHAPAFATATAPAAASASTSQASAAAPAAAYGVRLAQAAEKVADQIALGTRNGVSVARIQLSPASLGTIQIHLQHTDDGIVARVITEHPEAAQTLTQGSDQLRQTLAQNGTQLLRLDIQTAAGQQRPAPQQQPGANGSRHGRSRRHAEGRGHSGDSALSAVDEIPTRGLTNASLVNVLA